MRAHFRFWSELNDLLPRELREGTIPYGFDGPVAVKHAIEALGVPHVEVDLIMVGVEAVGFSYLLGEGDRIGVFPIGHEREIKSLSELRPQPPSPLQFAVDGHLGKLATYLRLLGFDAFYQNDIEDEEIARIACEQEHVLLTRDVRLLMRKDIVHGYWLRSKDPKTQVREVLNRYQLYDAITPWHRCLRCNGALEAATKEEILDRLEPLTKLHYHEFYVCQSCEQIYWKGSHYEPLKQFVQEITEESSESIDNIV
jgi:uncharacterized protein with PIN domain